MEIKINKRSLLACSAGQLNDERDLAVLVVVVVVLVALSSSISISTLRSVITLQPCLSVFLSLSLRSRSPNQSRSFDLAFVEFIIQCSDFHYVVSFAMRTSSWYTCCCCRVVVAVLLLLLLLLQRLPELFVVAPSCSHARSAEETSILVSSISLFV